MTRKLRPLPAPANLEAATPMIGEEALLLLADGFHVRVVIVAYRPAYGNARWLVSPVAGVAGRDESAVVSTTRLFLAP